MLVPDPPQVALELLGGLPRGVVCLLEIYPRIVRDSGRELDAQFLRQLVDIEHLVLVVWHYRHSKPDVAYPEGLHRLHRGHGLLEASLDASDLVVHLAYPVDRDTNTDLGMELPHLGQDLCDSVRQEPVRRDA